MKKKHIISIFIILLLLAGVIIKCYYVKYTDTWVRQHDVIGFGAEEGHAAYIEYIRNEKKLPDFDLREKWAFFQPPLHHIISAVSMDIASVFTTDSKKIEESTQIPTCIYMIFVMLLSVYIFLKAKGVLKLSYQNTSDKFYTKGCIALLGVVAVHPMFTIFSGSINNDSLPLFLSVLALVLAGMWYEKPGYLNTILLALTIGLAMFAKLTGGLVAIPIGILMFRKMFGFKDNEDGSNTKSKSDTKPSIASRVKDFFKYYGLKVLVFGAIVFPVGLFWSIRSKIKWDIPVNYIPPVGETFPDSVTFLQRIFAVSTKSPYTYMVSRGDAYDEFNVPLNIIKTSLYSEFSFADTTRWMKPVTWVLFISSIILALIALYATFKITFGKSNHVRIQWKILLFGTWVTYLLAYLYFALSSNNFSACDFRYAGICIVCSGVFLGLYIDSIELKHKWITTLITAETIVFALSSFATYFILGIKS